MGFWQVISPRHTQSELRDFGKNMEENASLRQNNQKQSETIFTTGREACGFERYFGYWLALAPLNLAELATYCFGALINEYENQ